MNGLGSLGNSDPRLWLLHRQFVEPGSLAHPEIYDDDIDALRSDWLAVGEDLFSAMKSHEAQSHE